MSPEPDMMQVSPTECIGGIATLFAKAILRLASCPCGFSGKENGPDIPAKTSQNPLEKPPGQSVHVPVVDSEDTRRTA